MKKIFEYLQRERYVYENTFVTLSPENESVHITIISFDGKPRTFSDYGKAWEFLNTLKKEKNL